jgi:hypothetical protein
MNANISKTTEIRDAISMADLTKDLSIGLTRPECTDVGGGFGGGGFGVGGGFGGGWRRPNT